MKFLQHGDSVVSLRFLYEVGRPGSFEENESIGESLTFDTVDEIQDAMADLFKNGEAPFNLQERVLDLDGIRAEGDYTESEMRAQLQSFQIDLNIMLDNQGTQAEVDRFMDALQEFMSARAIDLSGFIDETNELKANIEGENAAAETRLEFAGLAEMVLASESGDSIRATEIGIREDAERLAVPNNEQIAVAAPVESLRETLKAETAKVAEELGMSEPSLLASMDAFAAAESMNV